MAVSEKLYMLRKKSGLSQEQLAERLGVSRQAISKWEQGSAVPESDKLVAISDYFGVSLDYLLKDGEADVPADGEKSAQTASKTGWTLGLIACIGGAVCLIVWGILSILVPAASDKIGASSMIAIDGNGIFLIASVAAILLGAMLLLKSSKK